MLLDSALYTYRPLDFEAMQQAAKVIPEYDSFESFCKKGSNNKTFICTIMDSRWEQVEGAWHYHISANRFLRGMVRTVVGTLLMVGRNKIDVEGFENLVFAGAKRILLQIRPNNIIFEVCPRFTRRAGFDPSEPARVLERAGYKIFRFMESGELQPVRPEAAVDVVLENWVATPREIETDKYSADQN